MELRRSFQERADDAASGSMENRKPLISILLAVYEPQLDWLREQLDSLNTQTYPNLLLYLRDDCSQETTYEDIRRLVQECITSFPYSIGRNGTNLGSNRTFELLTREAEGEYFAYCDQDDIWLPEKLSVLQNAMEREGASLAYSDMSVIDADGVCKARTLKKVRPRLRYVSGAGVSEKYFFRNCTAGCSMLIRADIAKSAIPFPQSTEYDHWLCIVAACAGPVSFCHAPLVRYRQHGRNQTGILTGVSSAEDYRQKRLVPLEERVAFYREYAEPSPELEQFVSARLAGKPTEIWKHRSFSAYEAAFELLSGWMPAAVYRSVIQMIKRKRS